MDHDQTRRAFLLSATGVALGVGSAEAFGGPEAAAMNRRSTTVALTAQNIADRLEIEEVLTRYCYAVDDRDWDTYRKLFTPDAVIDDTVTGGVKSGVEEHVAYLTKALAKILISQHAISTTLIDLKCDEAKIRTHCSCPMVVELGEGERQVFFQGLWYRNRLVRTPEGWKIKELREEGYWTHNVPTGFRF